MAMGLRLRDTCGCLVCAAAYVCSILLSKRRLLDAKEGSWGLCMYVGFRLLAGTFYLISFNFIVKICYILACARTFLTLAQWMSRRMMRLVALQLVMQVFRCVGHAHSRKHPATNMRGEIKLGQGSMMRPFPAGPGLVGGIASSIRPLGKTQG